VAERDLTVKDVEREHLGDVAPGAHWVYIVGVIGGGTVLMLALIAWMAGAA
jgi:hypothetical protein